MLRSIGYKDKHLRVAIGLIIVLLIANAMLPLSAGKVSAMDDAPTVGLGGNDTLGAFLVGPNGMTLYLFTKDAPGKSNCADKCAVAWPPLVVEKDAKLTAGKGIPGTLASIERADGTYQVTYDDIPLYYWNKDKAAGESTGQDVGKAWYVLKPEAVLSTPNDKLGQLLVGANGMTLYTFTKDEAGKSNCVDKCAEAWPPLVVGEKEQASLPGVGVPGKISTIKRDDGKFQVAYNDMPLYFFAKDTAAGDTTGQGVGGVWLVAKPETVVTRTLDKLGDSLVGANGRTLYTFKKDEAGKSNCYDKCAEAWPPLLVVDDEKPIASKSVTGKLGSIERTDGKYQVTYNDMPLYYFAKDKFAGDATGQNVGEAWFVVKP